MARNMQVSSPSCICSVMHPMKSVLLVYQQLFNYINVYIHSHSLQFIQIQDKYKHIWLQTLTSNSYTLDC